MPVPGTNIRTLRQQMGISIKDLAASAGLNHGNLSRLETGRTGYSQATIEAIAKVLHVSVGVLFAEPDVVEAAALQMRRVPVLRYDQLGRWRGPDADTSSEDAPFLHIGLQSGSRFCFALRLQDEANAPVFVRGDDLIFDAKRAPKFGEFVAAVDDKGQVCIGRFRGATDESWASKACEVVPLDPLFATIHVPSPTGATIRGTLIESRRYFR